MKLKLYFLLGLIISISACKDTIDAEDYELKIDKKIAEIDAIIGEAESDNVEYCRIYYITGGGGCGPYFVYNSNTVDSALIHRKFDELNKLKEDYFNSGTHPTCDMAYPDSLIIENGRCKPCFRY
ncbi:MAG: hypothetical protein IPO21_07820 [Bacteroidales bacterium]|nr:hypothetical protein [Bacteroidales bacterium]